MTWMVPEVEAELPRVSVAVIDQLHVPPAPPPGANTWTLTGEVDCVAEPDRPPGPDTDNVAEKPDSSVIAIELKLTCWPAPPVKQPDCGEPDLIDGGRSTDALRFTLKFEPAPNTRTLADTFPSGRFDRWIEAVTDTEAPGAMVPEAGETANAPELPETEKVNG